MFMNFQIPKVLKRFRYQSVIYVVMKIPRLIKRDYLQDDIYFVSRIIDGHIFVAIS